MKKEKNLADNRLASKHFTEYNLSSIMQDSFFAKFKNTGFNLTMDDDSVFFIPFVVILVDKVSYYFNKKNISTSFEEYFVSFIKNEYEESIIAWGESNINWIEIEPFSKLKVQPIKKDYSDEWLCNEKTIV